MNELKNSCHFFLILCFFWKGEQVDLFTFPPACLPSQGQSFSRSDGLVAGVKLLVTQQSFWSPNANNMFDQVMIGGVRCTGCPKKNALSESSKPTSLACRLQAASCQLFIQDGDLWRWQQTITLTFSKKPRLQFFFQALNPNIFFVGPNRFKD